MSIKIDPQKYKDIWEVLKQDKVVRISSHPGMHQTIKRKIIKLKYKDKAYHAARLSEPLETRQEPDIIVPIIQDSILILQLMPMAHAIAKGYTKKKYHYLEGI